MNLNLKENLNITGHLTVSKVFKDGKEEIVFDDHNIIVSGMGVALANLLVATSGSILDYQIDRFQIGVGGNSSREVVSTYNLSSPLSSLDEYGINSYILATSANQLINFNPWPGSAYYALIPEHNITRVTNNTVRYTLILDELACNNISRGGVSKPLNEIGLFVKNIKGLTPEAPILVAYRYFGDILKTEEFSLAFRWSINF